MTSFLPCMLPSRAWPATGVRLPRADLPQPREPLLSYDTCGRRDQWGLWMEGGWDSGYQTGAGTGLPASGAGWRRRRRTLGACSISFWAGVSLAHLRSRPCAQAQA